MDNWRYDRHFTPVGVEQEVAGQHRQRSRQPGDTGYDQCDIVADARSGVLFIRRHGFIFVQEEMGTFKVVSCLDSVPSSNQM